MAFITTNLSINKRYSHEIIENDSCNCNIDCRFSVFQYDGSDPALPTKDELDKNLGKYEKVGTVTSTAQVTDPMDLKDELSKLADEKGANTMSFWLPVNMASSAQ